MCCFCFVFLAPVVLLTLDCAGYLAKCQPAEIKPPPKKKTYSKVNTKVPEND